MSNSRGRFFRFTVPRAELRRLRALSIASSSTTLSHLEWSRMHALIEGPLAVRLRITASLVRATKWGARSE